MDTITVTLVKVSSDMLRLKPRHQQEIYKQQNFKYIKQTQTSMIILPLVFLLSR